MIGSAVELLGDLEVGYGEAVLAQVQETDWGLRVVQQDGFELELSQCELSLCGGHLYLATVAKRVQMENDTVDFGETLNWVVSGPWAADDLDRLMGLLA